jgi:hypothetical protein
MNITKPRFNTAEAAEFLAMNTNTLKLSRHTGILAGVQAPAYRKIGKKVIYEKSTLELWLEPFEEQFHTNHQKRG